MSSREGTGHIIARKKRMLTCYEELSRLFLVKYELTSRSEEHTSELQSQSNLVCRLLLEKKKNRRKLQSISLILKRIPRTNSLGITAKRLPACRLHRYASNIRRKNVRQPTHS